MKKISLISLVALLTCCYCSCSYYPGITGKVLDNTTGQPIEGAVVVAQWTKPRGIPGMQYRELHKIVETLTNKKGGFSLSGTFGVLIDPPEMIIYKEGYIPWRNDSIFPYKDLDKHQWNDNVTYRLDVFTDKYTAVQLRDYLDSGMIGYGDVPIFHKIHNAISDKATDELRLIRDNKLKR